MLSGILRFSWKESVACICDSAVIKQLRKNELFESHAVPSLAQPRHVIALVATNYLWKENNSERLSEIISTRHCLLAKSKNPYHPKMNNNERRTSFQYLDFRLHAHCYYHRELRGVEMKNLMLNASCPLFFRHSFFVPNPNYCLVGITSSFQ